MALTLENVRQRRRERRSSHLGFSAPRVLREESLRALRSRPPGGGQGQRAWPCLPNKRYKAMKTTCPCSWSSWMITRPEHVRWEAPCPLRGPLRGRTPSPHVCTVLKQARGLRLSHPRSHTCKSCTVIPRERVARATRGLGREAHRLRRATRSRGTRSWMICSSGPTNYRPCLRNASHASALGPERSSRVQLCSLVLLGADLNVELVV